jgi:hypothetical protein
MFNLIKNQQKKILKKSFQKNYKPSIMIFMQNMRVKKLYFRP